MTSGSNTAISYSYHRTEGATDAVKLEFVSNSSEHRELAYCPPDTRCSAPNNMDVGLLASSQLRLAIYYNNSVQKLSSDPLACRMVTSSAPTTATQITSAPTTPAPTTSAPTSAPTTSDSTTPGSTTLDSTTPESTTLDSTTSDSTTLDST